MRRIFLFVLLLKTQVICFNEDDINFSGCGLHFSPFVENWCYLFNKSRVSWETAYETCRSYQADLLTFENATNTTAYIEKLKKVSSSGFVNIWIGLRLLNDNLQWTGRYPSLYTNKNIFSWNSSSHLTIANEECVFLTFTTTNTTLTPASCEMKKNFICIRQLDNAENQFVNRIFCDDGWLGHPFLGNVCLFINKKKASWNEAIDVCYKNNSTILSETTRVNLFGLASKLLLKNYEFWLNKSDLPEGKCHSYATRRVGCDEELLFICEKNFHKEIQVQIEMKINSSVQNSKPTVWINKEDKINLKCVIKIDGNVVNDEKNVIIYSEVYNGKYFTGMNTKKLSQIFYLSPHSVESIGTIDSNIGTYQCQVNIPAIPNKILSPKLTVLLRNYNIFFASLELEAEQKTIHTDFTDLTLLSLLQKRILKNNTSNLLKNFTNIRWIALGLGVKPQIEKSNYNTLLQMKMAFLVPDRYSNNFQRNLLTSLKDKQLFHKTTIKNISVEANDKCQTIKDHWEETITWQMDEENIEGYSDPVCVSKTRDHQPLSRSCNVDITKSAAWEPFDYNQCMNFNLKFKDDELCPSGYHNWNNVSCVREYIHANEAKTWFQAKDICSESYSSQLYVPSDDETHKNETWSNHKPNGKILYKRNNEYIGNFKYISEESQCLVNNFTQTNSIEISSSCSEKRAFRCATPKKLNFLTEIPWCPQGWVSGDASDVMETCYFMHFSQDSTYNKSQEHCSSLNSRLFTAIDYNIKYMFDETLRILKEKNHLDFNNVAFWRGSVVKGRIVYMNNSNGLEEETLSLNSGSSQDSAEIFNASTFGWTLTDKNNLHGFICEKSALETPRSAEVTLSKENINKSDCFVKLICKGQLVHPHSYLHWYLNGELFLSADYSKHTEDFDLKIVRKELTSQIIGTLCLKQTNRNLQGKFHCEIGGSEFIPSITSNEMIVLFPESNRMIVSVNVKNEATSTHTRIERMLNTLKSCESSDIKMEDVRLFQSENSSFNITIHFENYGKNQAWDNFEVCLNNNLQMNFLFKNPSLCLATEKFSGKGTLVLHWPTTYLGNIAELQEPCVSAEGNVLRRECSGDFLRGASWEEINEQCEKKLDDASLSLRDLSEKLIDQKNVSEAAEDLLKLVKKLDVLESYDINYISTILEKISVMDSLKEQIIKNVTDVVERVLSTNESTVNAAMFNSVSTCSISKALETIMMKSKSDIKIKNPSFYTESFTSKFNEIIGISGVFSSLSEFEKGQINPLKPNFTLSPEVMVAVILPNNSHLFNDSKTKSSFIIYKNNTLFPVNKSRTNMSINSLVISATLSRNAVSYLNPVKLIFRPVKMATSLHRSVCVFWDYSLNNQLGDWSEEGCWLDEVKGESVICKCNHLTHLSVFMDVHDQDSPLSSDHTFHLAIITYIGSAFSILGLCLTIITFSLFKQWRKKLGNKVLCNYSIALLLVLVIFLAGIEQVNSPKTCIFVAVLLHYFLLATFGWMLVEGILHYLLFVRIFNSYIPKFILKSIICAWGIPLTIVITVLSIDVNLYKGGPNYCWMSSDAIKYSFLLPIGIVIIINTILFILIIKSISCDRQKFANKSRPSVLQVYAAICLFVILGLTWVFGFLAIDKFRVFFQYLFCICNSVQGFLIFAFLVLRDNNAQELWMQFLSRETSSSAMFVPPRSNRKGSSNVLIMQDRLSIS